MGKKKNNIETIALLNLNKGEVFYSLKKDNVMTAAAGYYNKKIKTERLITVNPVTAEAVKMLKVTIL